MKKILLLMLLMFTFVLNTNAIDFKEEIRERNISIFETITVNIPSKIIYHYSPIYSYKISLSEDNFITSKNLNIVNINGNLDITTKNLNMSEKEELLNDSSDNIIINIYAPEIPNIKTTSRDLWISNNFKKTSTKNDKN